VAAQRVFVEAALRLLGFQKPPPARRYGRRRTRPEVEEAVCRLHVDVPHFGSRALVALLKRVSGAALSPTTARAILARRRDLLLELEAAKKSPRRIAVDGKLRRWAVDFTLVWLLGIVPIWLFGVVDFHGSRLLALEACLPTARGAVTVLEKLFAKVGAPEVLQSDNGGQFVAAEFGEFLRAHSVRHVRTRPAHPWTNGRVERLFRTLKEVLRWYAPVLLSRRHLGSTLRDFFLFYNSCRPHSAFGGRTPDEVFFAEEVQGPIGRALLFEGQVRAHRFR
jgi:transposase InsO family protein